MPLVGLIGEESAGAVGQATGLAQLLEHYGVHTAAEVLVEQGRHRHLVSVPCLVVVMVHGHVDVLSLVRSYPHLVLRGGLLGVLLVLEGLFQSLRGLVYLVEELDQIL